MMRLINNLRNFSPSACQSQLLFLLIVLFLGFICLFFGCGESLLLYAGYSLALVLELLIAVASLIAKRGLQGMWASVAAAHELSSCDSWTRAQAQYCGAGA